MAACRDDGLSRSIKAKRFSWNEFGKSRRPAILIIRLRVRRESWFAVDSQTHFVASIEDSRNKSIDLDLLI
jgi:hypothetical protein